FAPRFLSTLGHPHAVALHFAHCGQLAAGLSPTRVRPCWAHKKRPARSWPIFRENFSFFAESQRFVPVRLPSIRRRVACNRAWGRDAIPRNTRVRA
ncbi:hypothetical protein F0185_32795, partial [Massilia sp. CCM 8692]|nr:hypothetical protein [Massilia rubra]